MLCSHTLVCTFPPDQGGVCHRRMKLLLLPVCVYVLTARWCVFSEETQGGSLYIGHVHCFCQHLLDVAPRTALAASSCVCACGHSCMQSTGHTQGVGQQVTGDTEVFSSHLRVLLAGLRFQFMQLFGSPQAGCLGVPSSQQPKCQRPAGLWVCAHVGGIWRLLLSAD